MKLFLIFPALTFVFLTGNLKAQNNRTDSLLTEKARLQIDSVENELIADLDSEVSSPVRAALLSAVLPGLGQVYNKSYWKVPIIYSGFAVFALVLDYNNYYYIFFRNALLAELDNDPATTPPPFVTSTSASRNADFYRRNRDFSIILTGLFYLLNVVEAHVDAHLQDFDISDDVTVQIKPGLQPVMTSTAIGLSLVINLN